MYPETLEADEVLPAIIERLTARGILDKRTADAPTPLRRSLTAKFRSETLETQWQALSDEGVHHWFVVDEESTALSVFGGTERHLLVSVELAKMDRAHDQGPREDVRLTLRGESIEDSRERESDGHSFGWGATSAARGGQHDSGTDEQGHGGLDGAYGSTRRHTRLRTVNRKDVDIYRANPHDDSYEFTHRLTFRVRLALTSRLPEVLDSIGWVAGKTAAALAWPFGHKDTIERAWQSAASLWSWRDDAADREREMPGLVRLLIPTHLTVEAEPSELPLLHRSTGKKARWVSRPRPAAGTADDSGAPGTSTPKHVAELLTDLHPWDLPAARVIREWAKVAAERTRREPDLRAPRTRSVPAVEHGTRAGLFYLLATKHGFLRARTADLLAHTHTLDVAGRSVTVGIDLTAARPLHDKEVFFKSRRYQQNDKDTESGNERLRGSRYDVGPEAGGGATEDFAWLGRLLYRYDREHEGRVDGGAVATVEHNQEAKRPFRYYVFDVTVVMRGNGRELLVDAPGGLVAMLPTVDGRPAPAITAELGHLFRDVPSVRSLSAAGPPRLPLPAGQADTAALAAPPRDSAQAPLPDGTSPEATEEPPSTPPATHHTLTLDVSPPDLASVAPVGVSHAQDTTDQISSPGTPPPGDSHPGPSRPESSAPQTDSDRSAPLPAPSGDDARTPDPRGAEHDARTSAPLHDAAGPGQVDTGTPASDAHTADGGTGRQPTQDPEPDPGAGDGPPPRFALGRRMDLDDLAYFSATPRAGLPGMERVVDDLRTKVPGVSEDDLESLPVTLEQNFRKLVSPGGEQLGGYLMRLGRAEVLFTARPQNARLERSSLADDERAPFGTEANAAMFNTGSFSESSTVSTMPFSAGGSVGVPAGPVTPAVNVSATANAKHRGMNTAHFVEDGQVSNHRTANSLLTVDLNLSYRIRSDGDATEWKRMPENRQPPADRAPTEGDDRLTLWIPDRFLTGQHAKLALKAEAGPPAVPERYAALGMTGLPELYDEALRGLRARWSHGRSATYLRGDSGVREELRNGIDKLATNLRRSQAGGGLPGQAEEGYAIDLHEPGTAKTIATVRVITRILDAPQAARDRLPAIRMFSDAVEAGSANIERVQTLLNAAGASNGVEQRRAVGFAVRATPPVPKIDLGISASAAMGASRTQGSSASYDGLKVTVSRWAGPTPFYSVPMEYNLEIEVREPSGGNEASTDEDLRSVGIVSLTLPDAAAYDNGFPVDETSVGRIVQESDPQPITGSDRRHLPTYMKKTVGMSPVRFDPAVIDALGAHIRSKLREIDYLPPAEGPFADVSRLSHRESHDVKIDNGRALENWLMGIGDHFNSAMTEEGAQLRLRRRPGVGPAPWTEEFATVNLKVAFDLDDADDLGPAHHERLAILLMALRIAGQSHGGSENVSVNLNFGIAHDVLKNAGLNIGGGYSAGSNRGEIQVFNHPVLFEPTGDLRKHRIRNLRLEVTIAKGNTGKVPGHRVGGDRVVGTGKFTGSAELLVPNLPADLPAALSTDGKTPSEVFERAVILSLETSGVTKGLLDLLPPDLRGAASPVEHAIRQLTTHHTMVAQAPHMLQGAGHYDMDNGAAYGLWKNAYTVMSGALEVKEATHLGTTDEPVVLALIALLQNQVVSGQFANYRFGFGTFGATLGGESGDAAGTGTAGVDMSYSRGISEALKKVGGFETIALSVGSVLVYGANTKFKLGVDWYKNAALLPSDRGSGRETLDDRQMVFMVPRDVALQAYLKGDLPVLPEALVKVVELWNDGDWAQLKLGAVLMARLLLHWRERPDELPEGTDLSALAAQLSELHRTGGLRVVDEEVLRGFNDAFPEYALTPVTLHLPRYLANPYEPHRRIGPTTVNSVRFANGMTLWGKIRDLVQESAPGLLSSSPLLEVTRGGHILGKVHGGLMTAEVLFSKLSTILYMDMVGGEVEIQFANTVGPLHETVSVVLSAELVGQLRPSEERMDGQQFFLHGQAERSRSASRSKALSGAVKAGGSGHDGNGGGALGLSLGTGTQVDYVRTQYWESVLAGYNKTVDFDGDLNVTLQVRLGDAPNAAMNNFAMAQQRKLAGRSSSAFQLPGTIQLGVPAAMLGPEEPFQYRPPSTIPVEFPLNTHPVGFVSAGGYKRQIQSLLSAVFGASYVAPGVRPDTFLPAMMANSLLTAQAVRESPEGTRLTDSLAMPSDPQKRAIVMKQVEYTDLRVLKVVDGEGGFGTYFKHITSVTPAWKTNNGAAPVLNAGHGSPLDSEGGNLGNAGSTDAAGSAQEQPRTESYARERKPVYLVVANAAIRLPTVARRHHLIPFLRPQDAGTFHSQKVSCEFYALVDEDGYQAMRAAVDKARAEQADRVLGWEREPKSIQHFDLTDILLDVAREASATAEAAPALVARAIGDRMDHGRLRTGRPEVLLKAPIRARHLITDSRRLVLDFDADRIDAAFDADRTDAMTDPGVRPVTTFQEPEDGVLSPDQPALGANILHLVSRAAVELDSYVELRVRQGGAERTWWFHPAGRIHAFDPEQRSDGSPLTTAEALSAGVLTPEVARLANRWGVSAELLGKLESTSYSRDLTLDQAVRQEIDVRRSRSLRDRSAELFERATTMLQALDYLGVETQLNSAAQIGEMRVRTESARKQLHDLVSNADITPAAEGDVLRIRKEMLKDEAWLRKHDGQVHALSLAELLRGDGPSAPAPAAQLPEPAPTADPAAPEPPGEPLTFQSGEPRRVLGKERASRAHALAVRLREVVRVRRQRGLPDIMGTMRAGGSGNRLPRNNREST
ncbi:hypothetical protein [Streptomyces sp. NPDC002172]